MDAGLNGRRGGELHDHATTDGSGLGRSPAPVILAGASAGGGGPGPRIESVESWVYLGSG